MKAIKKLCFDVKSCILIRLKKNFEGKFGDINS